MTPEQSSMTYAYVLVEELNRLGIEHCCMAPGARSSALSIAMQMHSGILCHIFADERSASFSALGMAKCKPKTCSVAILTTSGTAVANVLPAMVEAHESEVSILILTADRPPELRHSRANQCIQQPNLFGHFVRKAIDFPVQQRENWHHSVSQLDYLVFRSQHPIKGPVHANLMFREPMGIESDLKLNQLPNTLAQWSTSTQPYTSINRTDTLPKFIEDIIQSTERGCLVIGSLPVEWRSTVETFVTSLGWPVILDGASGLRYRNIKNTIMFHNQVARLPNSDLQLQTIIRIGHTFSNKWIDRSFIWNAQNRIAIDWTYTNPSPESNCNHVIVTENLRTIQLNNTNGSNELLRRVNAHNEQAKQIIQNLSSKEMILMRELHGLIPKDGLLFIGNSMPIRDFSNVSSSNRPDITVFTNRGASGIDGLISTAAGLAVSANKHCTIVLGDLSAIHDLASLLFLKALPLRLRIIVVNNSGGQIFQNLPLSKSDYFSPTFDAAHNIDLSIIVQAMNIDTHQVNHVDAIKSIEIPEQPQIQFIELLVDKESEQKARNRDIQALSTAITPIWSTA